MIAGPLLTGLKVAGGVASALQARSAGMAQSANLRAQAQLQETQALQVDTQHRDELDQYLGAAQVARAANGLSSSSPNALRIFNDANVIKGRERARDVANFRQRAANTRAAAGAAARGARFNFFGGLIDAGIPLAEAIA